MMLIVGTSIQGPQLLETPKWLEEVCCGKVHATAIVVDGHLGTRIAADISKFGISSYRDPEGFRISACAVPSHLQV